MEHIYLLRPGRWRAEGTYYDDAGRAFPLTGRSELIQDGPERCLEGWMEVAGPQPLRFANHYTIRETDRPCTLAWQSVNPALGVLEGTFELAGESIRPAMSRRTGCTRAARCSPSRAGAGITTPGFP